MGAIGKLRELGSCVHPSTAVSAIRVDVGLTDERREIEWCTFCGALRYKVLRRSGEVAALDWLRPSGVATATVVLDRPLSERADTCLSALAWRRVPAVALARRFGVGALLELVFRDLVDIDEAGLCSRKGGRPVGSLHTVKR